MFLEIVWYACICPDAVLCELLPEVLLPFCNGWGMRLSSGIREIDLLWYTLFYNQKTLCSAQLFGFL